MSVEEIERSPFILPPVPENFVVQGGVVAPTAAPPPVGEWLGGYIRHFSASSLKMLKICPEQYRQRYILGRKERPSSFLTLGTAVHGAVAASLNQRLENGDLMSTSEAVEFFHDKAWPTAVESDGGIEMIRFDQGEDEDHVRRDGERMTQAYHHTVAPRIIPVAPAERRIDIFIEGVPVPLIGYLDVEEELHVTDLKTGRAVQRKPDANWRFQGTLYSLATKKPTHFHSLSRAKTPSIATPLTDPEMVVPYQEDLVEMTTRVVRDYAGQVEYFMNRYGPDDPWPTSGVFMDYKGGAACRFCGFRKFCVAWAHERVVPS